MHINPTEFFTISPSSLKKLICNYIPSELLPSEWDCADKNPLKNVQNLIDMSNGKLKMYGTAEELLDSLNTFQRFPGSHELLGFELAETYSSSPQYLKSMKGSTYVYKHDYFVILQGMIPYSPLRRYETEVAMATVATYLKIRESLLKSDCELVPLAQSDLERIKNNIQIVNNSLVNSAFNDLSLLKFENHTIDELFLAFEKLFPSFEDERVYDSLKAVLRKFVEKFPICDNEFKYRTFFSWSGLMILEMMLFLEENSALVLPRSQITDQKCAPIVRIFSDKSNKFIMARELLRAMKQENMSVTSFEEEILAMPELSTFTYKQVADRVSKEDLKTIEFVITPIILSKYTAIPIPHYDGYCILAADILLNLLRNMISIKKVFQKIKPSQFNLFEEFFKSINQYFYSSNGIHFIDLEDVMEIDGKWEIFYKTLNISNEDSKEVRDVKKTEFTIEDFKEELSYLKFDASLPEIPEKSEIVFKQFCALKKILTTSNVYEIIEHLLIGCIIRRIPEMAQFIHSQLACSRVLGYQCETCLGAKKVHVPDLKPVGVPKPVEIPMETKKVEKFVLESVIKVEENQKSTFEPKLAKPKKSKKQKSSEKPIAKTEEKQSNACPKCFRASEYNIKLREDLRLEKIETKHLKKSLKQAQQESEENSQIIVEKNEEIEHLKAQLQTTQQEVLDQKSEINHEKDETIRLQVEQILDHQNALVKKSLQVIERDEEIQLLKAQIQAQKNAISQQKISIRNLELENRKLIQKRPTHVAETIPQRSAEETEKVQTILFEMLKTQAVLEVENPMNKITKMTSKLIEVSKNRENKIISKREFIYFERQIRGYTKEVENRIKMIKSNQKISSNQIPELRDFPAFSDEFLKAYKKTFKENAPLICAQLLKTPEPSKLDDLEDKECLVCLEDMKEGHETLKCSNCKRQYHTGCAQKWFKVKRICPTCNSGLLDDTEFPALS